MLIIKPTVGLLFYVTIRGVLQRRMINRWKRCGRRSVPRLIQQYFLLISEQHRSFKYERMKLRHALFKMDPKYKKQKKYMEDESDIDEEWVASYEGELKASKIEKTEKKFIKENEKLEEDGKKPQMDSVLKDRVQAIEEEYDRLVKERGTKKATLKRDRSVEKIEEAIEKLDDKIKTFKLQIVDRDAGKEVALGTRSVFVYFVMCPPMLMSSPQ